MVRNIPDETTRAAALRRGEVDVAYNLSGSVAEDIRRTPGLTITARRSNAVFFLDFLEQWDPKSPWADRRVRLAASTAVDRKTILTAWREKKLRGVLLAAQGAGGNAATRIEGVATRGGLHQIQRLLAERVVFAPIWENAPINGVGPRVEEAALTLVPAYPYTAPFEELRLKSR